MRTGRPKAELVLTNDESRTLRAWSLLEGDVPAYIGLRARIVLAAATGAFNKDVAARLGVAPATVCKWRRRFIDRRLDGLWPPRR